MTDQDRINTLEHKINTLENYLIHKYGQQMLDQIYFQAKVEATNKVLEIADADEFDRLRMETR